MIVLSKTGMPVHVFDLQDEPCVLKTRQWSPTVQRDPKDQRGICLHQWDTEVGTELRFRRQYGEPEALARRALRVPAHISVGVTQLSKTPIVSIAHPLTRYLMGSDAANAHYLTMEVMGNFPFEEATRSMHHTEITEVLEAAVEVGLEVAATLLNEWAGSAPWEVITHRQACNSKGDHRTCCGEAVVAMACKATSNTKALFDLNPDRVLVPEWGKAWPASWRSHIPKKVLVVVPSLPLQERDPEPVC